MLYGRIRETPNGILIGKRKFTPKELDQYCKNMYGEHWRAFRSKKYWKSLSPEERRRVLERVIVTFPQVYLKKVLQKHNPFAILIT